MWIKTQNGDWIDTSKIQAVTVTAFVWDGHSYISVKALISYSYVELADKKTLKTEADARAYADDFVAKYLKEDNHVD